MDCIALDWLTCKLRSVFGKKKSTPCPPTIDRIGSYKITRETAGLVVIINQQEFHREANKNEIHLLPKEDLKKRIGTDVDRDLLRDAFKSFSYEVDVYDNLTCQEIFSRISEAVVKVGKKTGKQPTGAPAAIYDSFIVCILSSGIEGCVYGANSIPIEIKSIENILKDSKLAGIPKMLLIQACQGTEKLQVLVS